MSHNVYYVKSYIYPGLFSALLIALLLLLPGCNKVDLGVSGPEQQTVLQPAVETSLDQYAHGTSSRLAVLVTDADSAWLGLAHGLKSIGVPFLLTTDWRQAVRHKTIVVYPRLSGKLLNAEALEQLAQHVQRRSGLLIAFDVLGRNLGEVFGIEGGSFSQSRFKMQFAAPVAEKLGFSEAREREIPLGDSVKAAKAIGSYAYEPVDGTVFAHYEDGTAAMIGKTFSSGGAAIAIGVDFGDYMLRGFNNRADLLSRSYVNAYKPATDVLLRWLRDQYRRYESLAVTLDTVPDGRELSVVLTHDVDYQRSIENAIAYAEYEKSQGVRATYFIQTKYMRDWSDVAFFDRDGLTLTARIEALGGEIASHSVSHSHSFKDFPIGSGDEQYPAYSPFVRAFDDTAGGTILGELRVSKFLLEEAAEQVVESFRPGHLSNPAALPQLLQATGYKYSSSVTANDSLTHLPFRLNHMRGADAETAIYEFPVTMEDEVDPPLGNRLQPALQLAEKIARYGGLYVVLIHPDVVDHKLAFEKGLIAALRNRAWFGALQDFGDWWTARDQVAVDVTAKEGTATLRLVAPKALNGLALDIPATWSLREGRGIARQTKVGRIMLDKLQGTAELEFSIGATE